jgi:murein hydrolase activator
VTDLDLNNYTYHFFASRIRLVLILVMMLFTGVMMAQQDKKELERKRDELTKKIKYTENLISTTKNHQRMTQTELMLLNKKITLREEKIKNIRYQVTKINKRIEEQHSVVEAMKKDLERLKEEYAEMIRQAYRNRNSYDQMMFIFSSTDFNQAYKRLKYMQQYAQYREKQAEMIKLTQQTIENNLKKLEAEKQEKLALLSMEDQEKLELKKDKDSQQDNLRKLMQEENKLRAELKKQQQDVNRLNAAIQRIIEEEIRRAKEASKTKTFQLTPEAAALSSNFENNKGKLPWPVERGIVCGKYGEHPHPFLPGIVVKNNGVDICTDKGAVTRAVFEGEVSGVIEIPGAGKAVLVSHGAYISVYSNLKEVFVSKSQKIKVKQDLGTVLTDAEGNTKAHLEIWKIESNGKSNMQDPERWIYK